MNEFTTVLETLASTSLGQELKQLYNFFEDTKNSFTFFQEKYNIHCPSGCGECCRHFVPDITKLEALLVASYIRFCMPDWEAIKQKLEFFKTNNFEFCPLFRENTPYHCSVYEARPLICRLFGNSCNQDKMGNAVFKRCKYNYQPEIMTESLCVTDQKEIDCLPIMENYGLPMMNLEGNSQDRVLLFEGVLDSLDKINYYIQLLDIDVASFSPSNPDGSDFPSPQAS